MTRTAQRRELNRDTNRRRAPGHGTPRPRPRHHRLWDGRLSLRRRPR